MAILGVCFFWGRNAHFGVDGPPERIRTSDLRLLKGDLLIDDYAEGKGQEGFEGELLHFGSDAFPNWLAISKTLL